MRLSRRARYILSATIAVATTAAGVTAFQDSGAFALAFGAASGVGAFMILTELVRSARRERHRRRFE